MHKLQAYIKVWSFTTPACSGMSVPSWGSSYTDLKLPKIINYIYNIQCIQHSEVKFRSVGWMMHKKCYTHIIQIFAV